MKFCVRNEAGVVQPERQEDEVPLQGNPKCPQVKLIYQLINDWNFIKAYLAQGKDDDTSSSKTTICTKAARCT